MNVPKPLEVITTIQGKEYYWQFSYEDYRIKSNAGIDVFVILNGNAVIQRIPTETNYPIGTNLTDDRLDLYEQLTAFFKLLYPSVVIFTLAIVPKVAQKKFANKP